jgi:hypothetical protein
MKRLCFQLIVSVFPSPVAPSELGETDALLTAAPTQAPATLPPDTTTPGTPISFAPGDDVYDIGTTATSAPIEVQVVACPG